MEEDRDSDAGRFVPPDLIWDLHAARRDLAAFSSSNTVFRVGKSEAAISEMLFCC